MITDESHPEMARAFFDLKGRLAAVSAGRYPSRSLFADLIQVRDDHRARWRASGVDFPATVLVSVPRLLLIEYWRADLDFASIRVKTMNLVMAHPTVTVPELTAALRAAYPDLHTRALSDEGEAMLKRIRHRAEAESRNTLETTS